MNTLYTIESQALENRIDSRISIDPNHAVFKGHFPNQPVMPGVCMLQMLEDALSSQFNSRLQLKYVSMMKFIRMWLPTEHAHAQLTVTYQLTSDELRVTACKIFEGDIVFFKFKGLFHVED